MFYVNFYGKENQLHKFNLDEICRFKNKKFLSKNKNTLEFLTTGHLITGHVWNKAHFSSNHLVPSYFYVTKTV